MSISKKGMFSGERNPMYGVHLSVTEEKKKMLSEKFSGAGNPMYGVHRKHTQEEKQAMSVRMSGDRNPFFGKTHDEETKKRMSESKKKSPVICVETGQRYESINMAGNKTGIHTGSISRACKTGGIAGGYHWNYIVA